jgi:hypothetical protein
MRKRNDGSLPADAGAPGVLPGMLPGEEVNGSGVKKIEIRDQ